MSGGAYPGLTTAVSDALSGYSAHGIHEPDDVEQCPRGAAAWLQDAGFSLMRVADELAQTGIRQSIPERLADAAAAVQAAAADTADLTSFDITSYHH